MIVFNCMFFYVGISILLLYYILYCLCPFSVKDKAQEYTSHLSGRLEKGRRHG